MEKEKELQKYYLICHLPKLSLFMLLIIIVAGVVSFHFCLENKVSKNRHRFIKLFFKNPVGQKIAVGPLHPVLLCSLECCDL